MSDEANNDHTLKPVDPEHFPPFEWAIVEIFGHRRHVGRAREEERFGAKMLRIDVPSLTADPTLFDAADGKKPEPPIVWASHYYGGSSIFSYTPTDEATVMRFAERRPMPAIPYRAHDLYDDETEYDRD